MNDVTNRPNCTLRTSFSQHSQGSISIETLLILKRSFFFSAHRGRSRQMSNMKTPLKIVRLDGINMPSPQFSIPHLYTEYHTTSHSEVASRISDAEIIISSNVPLPAEALDCKATPKLRLITVMTTGTDLIDLGACHARGILVCNVPAGSNESVAQHTIALFLALRRRITRMNDMVVEDHVWSERGTCTGDFGGVTGGWLEEIVGIIGVEDLDWSPYNFTRGQNRTGQILTYM
jgi:hypothetical protein